MKVELGVDKAFIELNKDFELVISKHGVEIEYENYRAGSADRVAISKVDFATIIRICKDLELI